ncbi:MAG: acyltransferase family protein [Rhodoglobus sp.]
MPVRYPSVDLARGAGLIGVFIAHTAPITAHTPFYIKWINISENVAAPLFTLMLGLSLGLLVSARSDGQSRARFRLQLTIRSALLVVLGLAAGMLGANVIPILQYFGVVYLVLLPVLFLRARWLLLLAGAMAIVSPLLMTAVQGAFANWMSAGGAERWYFSPVYQLAELLFSGYGYRVTGLLVFALVGLAVAKAGVGNRSTLVATSLGGGVLMLVGYGLSRLTAISAAAYSGTTLELLGATGLALVTFSLCGWLFAGQQVAWLRGVARVLSPVSALGSMTLTVYLLHIVVLGLWARTMPGINDDSWPMMFGLIAGSLVFAVLWKKFVGKGPVEWLMGFMAFGHRSWSSERSRLRTS